MDVRDELSGCIIDLLLQEPFYGHLLGGVVRCVTEETPTAAVALTPSGIQLRVNPTWFLKGVTKRRERVAVVKHECLHLLFKHLFRFTDGRRRDMRLYNIAADLVVNQFIGSPWRLPEGAVTLALFPDLDLEEDQTAEWYYDKLHGLRQEMEDSGWGGGACDFPQSSAPTSAGNLSRLVDASWHSDHSCWGHGQDMGEGLEGALGNDLDRLIVNARDRTGPRVWGKLPGRIQSLVQAILDRRKPQVDWRRAMRIFASSSRRTKIVGTQKRESRRYAEQAALPAAVGPIVPGIRVRQYSRLAVAIDTSGSVADREIALFFGEIHGMWRAGAEVTVIECDADVQRVYPYRGKLPETVAGRGGTVFDPVFAYLRARRDIRYDGCIYLTDGGAAEPEIKPPCKLLWVVTRDGWVGDHLRYGRVIQLPE